MTYLNNFDNISWTDNFRIKLHLGFAGCKGYGGVGDAIHLCKFGLYVVNTGGAGHPGDLQHKTTKIPRTQDREDHVRGTQAATSLGASPPSTAPSPRLWMPISKPRAFPQGLQGYKQWFFPNSGIGDVATLLRLDFRL